MRFVHSYWTKPRKEDYDYSIDLWYAATSVSYIHKLGHEIVLYTDSKGELIFNILPYDHIYNVLDDLHETVDPHIWSASKFKAIELEPLGSIHIDYDFILKEDNLIKFDWYHDMLCQHMLKNNTDYDFVSRYMRKACSDLILPDGITHDFTEHILHLGCWAIYRLELKDEIISAYKLFSTELSKKFPTFLWDLNPAFIPNLSLEEKLVGLISLKYKVACMIDIWNDSENKLNLHLENDLCEHFAGSEKIKRVKHVKETLEKIDTDLYNKLLKITKS